MKSNIVRSILLTLIFLFVGIALILVDAKYLFSDPRDFNEIIENGEPEIGEYVTINVKAVIDWYAETEHKINGIIPAGTEKHCIVWLDDGGVISMTVKGKNVDKVDELISPTWEYLEGTAKTINSVPVCFSGKVSSNSGEVTKYYKDVLDYYGIDEDEGATVYHMTIDTTESKVKTWGLFGFCMLMVVVCFTVTVREVKK